MGEWRERLYAFNERNNDLPRKILYLAVLFAVVLLAAKVFPYVAPFAVAGALAWVLEPVMKLLTRQVGRLRVGRKVAAAVVTLVVLTLILTTVLVLCSQIISEVKDLIGVAPGWISRVYNRALECLREIDINWEMVPEETLAIVEEMLKKVSDTAISATTSLASSLTVWFVNAAMSLPGVTLFIVLLFMGMFYILGDRPAITAFIDRHFPQTIMRRGIAVKGSLIRSLFGQLRSGLIMLMVTTTELIISFSIMRLDYAVLLALLIAVMDAMPVIGAGLFLIPMAVYNFVVGNIPMGIGMAITYAATIVVRQMFEPKILGHQLGLHPLATMMAMYAGFMAVGFIGMALGPMLLLIARAVLAEACPGEETPAAAQTSPIRRIRFRRKGNKSHEIH